MEVMFWNVENFFDWRNDSTTVSDMEFSAAGERHWTWKRFQAKANAFAKALFWVEAETGRLPDIIGLEEVENAFVLRQVLQKTALRKLDYKYVHYDSPDHRGIDVALFYRSSRLELLDSKPCHLYVADSVMATRDILLCVFRRDSAKVAVLVNHHPSKYGGAAESEPRRRIAVERLRFLADSLAAIGIDRIIAGGDFNDTPDNPVFRLLEPALAPMHMDLFRRGLGTIKYDGKWDRPYLCVPGPFGRANVRAGHGVFFGSDRSTGGHGWGPIDPCPDADSPNPLPAHARHRPLRRKTPPHLHRPPPHRRRLRPSARPAGGSIASLRTNCLVRCFCVLKNSFQGRFPCTL